MPKMSTGKTIGLASTMGINVLVLGILWYLAGKVDPIHKRGVHSAVVFVSVLLAVQVVVFLAAKGI